MEKKTKKTIITALVIGVIGYALYKAFTPTPPTNNGGGGNGGGTPPNGSGTPPNTTQNLDFNALANTLFDAFNGVGTKNDVWRSVLIKLKNQADWDALLKAYGTKTITAGWGGFIKTCSDCDLVKSFKSELSSTELEQLNTILKSKNINTI
jgi:hypothetical protein